MYLDTRPPAARTTLSARIRRGARPRRAASELTPNAIAACMLAGITFGLILVELIALATGRPGISVMLGAAL